MHVIWLLVGCAPSIDSAPAKAASAYCKRAEECSLLQEGERKDSCEPQASEGFEAMWTQDFCPEGFERKAWSACMDVIQSWDCEDIAAGWVEIGEACDSHTVCE